MGYRGLLLPLSDMHVISTPGIFFDVVDMIYRQLNTVQRNHVYTGHYIIKQKRLMSQYNRVQLVPMLGGGRPRGAAQGNEPKLDNFG